MGVTKQVLPTLVELLAQCGELFARGRLRSMLRHSARPSRTSGSGLCSQCTALVTHGGLQSCTRAARSFLAVGRSWPPSRARRSGESAESRGSARTRSVHRAWSVSAAEPVLRPTWRHRTAKLARRGRAQGSAGPSGERARRDRREPLAPLVRRDLPARKATRVRRRSFASSPERRRYTESH